MQCPQCEYQKQHNPPTYYGDYTQLMLINEHEINFHVLEGDTGVTVSIPGKKLQLSVFDKERKIIIEEHK